MQKPREAQREEMATEGGVKGGGGRVELETLIIDSVGEVASAIEAAEHVDEVICALYSLAVRIFPVDSSALCDNVGQAYRSKICEVTLPTDVEMSDWRQAFYYGAAFPALARLLIYNVAKKWLACFPLSTKKQVYDSFFVKGPPTEIVQVLVPALTHGYDDAFYSNIERLLVRCLLKSEGIRRMIGEFRIQCQGGELDASGPGMLAVISRVAQLLTSIPDKTRLQASSALSSHLFFQQVAIQLLNGAEDCESVILNKRDASDANILDGSLLFIGESFSRICRRGSTDILIIHMIPRVLDHVRSCLSSTVGSNAYRMIESSPKSQFWLYMMEAMKDQYAVERLTEALLRQLATQNISDVEAYWTLWLLFHQTFNQKITMRSMFVDKFLVWKVFPICCLRWILQFSVFECPPNSDSPASSRNRSSYLDVVDQLSSIWSRREFVQSSSMEQQAYVTAAVGLCLERMSTEELEKTKDVMKYILQGVRCRLENPNGLVRKMACSVALAFSKVVDPKKPLYLDDDCSDIIDWEFGLTSLRKDVIIDHQTRKDESKVSLPEERKNASHAKRPTDMNRNPVNGTKMILENKVHSSKIMDSAVPSNKLISAEEEEDDDEGKNSDASSDSLEPYDLSDDDSDLRKFSQLGDVVAALRKPDDPDGVEKALDVVEKLVRASPDELPHHSGDLVRVLVHVHCSDVAVEGEEDSAEEKRQKALVALLVTCPFESLDVLTRALYSPNVDVSQRILILDVMTEAAQELSESTVIRRKHQPRNLISTISGQPWFIPSSRGPPGAGPWKEVSDPGTSINWSHRYEREIPSRAGQIKSGKSRKWVLAKAKDPLLETSKNRFPLYAAAFMLPVMQGFDKRRHGVDLLGRDFIVLGKLIYMLGVCMKCVTMHPEASALAPALLDMIRSRELSHHPEAYVRRSLLFAASCILVALHPSHVASALIEGNQEISNGLEWIRTWALHIAESDPDAECSTMAMTCLQLHAEMALQTSRALESAESIKARTTTHQPLKLDKIIIPFTADMR